MNNTPDFRDFIKAAASLEVQIYTDELLARHTTFRIGGPADLYVTAAASGQLEALATLAAERNIPITILGGGSNVLVSDAGVRGLVIANRTRALGVGAKASAQAEAPGAEDDPYLVADSGVPLAGLARWAMKNGWAGLEWAVSIPGTVGGAVIGNAGADGGDMASSVAWVAVSHPGQGRQVLSVNELAYTYRSSRLKEQLVSCSAQASGLAQQQNPALCAAPIILTVGLRAVSGDAAEMETRAESYLARRRASQPVEPSAGSIFRNPPGDFAGRLIEAAGLKGHQIGGAQISPRHANFIVNIGHACATDVVALMNLMRRRVHDANGSILLPEIIFLGDWMTPPLFGL